MKKSFDLVEATFELARSQRLTFREARQELGRRGASARATRRRRREASQALLERKKIA